MAPVKLLCIGDVVGKPGRRALAELLAGYIQDHEIDFVICNAENAAGGSGLTPSMFHKILHYGVDAVTLGDHVYRKRDIISELETSEQIVRPANLSARAAGRRWNVVPTKNGSARVGYACVLGQVYMGANDSPWTAIDRVMSEIPSDVTIRVVDMHAEATSEKVGMGWYLNGRASVVFGTHTHVPTADGRVLDGGTAFISDVGMTGPYDSILGRRKDRVLSFMSTSMPTSFDVALRDVRICGFLAEVDATTGRAQSCQRVELHLPDEDAQGAPAGQARQSV